MKNEKRLLPLLFGATALAVVAATAVYAQVVVGRQDFSITVQPAADETPNAFGFASILDVQPNTLVSSAPITISGIDVPVNVSVSGSGSPQFRINSGAWGTTGQVQNGQTIEVRLTSAPNYWDGVTSFNTTRQAVLTVGTGTGTFFVRNVLGSAAPNAFVFAGTTGVVPGARVTSDPVTISGMQISGPITVSGAGSPEISVNGGSWGTSGTISNGQTVQVRMTAPLTYEAVRGASVTIGGVSGSWALTTADCVTADLFSLAVGQSTCYNNLNVVNAGSGLITAGTTGTDYPSWTAARDLCAALGSEWGLPAGTAMVGANTVNTNRDLTAVAAVLTLSNSSTYWTATTNQTVTLGPIPQTLTGVNSSASVICMTQPALTSQFVASEYLPDPFTIASGSGVPSSLVTSEPVTISGIASGRTVQMNVSAAAGVNPTFSINGGAFSADARSVRSGDVLLFRVTASVFDLGTVVLTAQTRDPAGTLNRSATFTVTSVASAAERVDAFSFNWQYFPQTYSGTLPGGIYESEVITLAGGSGTRPLQVLNSSGYYNSGTLNRWPRIYGSRIYYKATNVTITSSLTSDSTAVMWSTANTNYPDIVTDVGRTIRLRFSPENNSAETYSVLCVASTCAEYVWTNSSTRTDPRAAKPYDIADLTEAQTSTSYTSSPFTVSWDARTAGVQPPNIPISISGAGTPEYRINGGAWTNVSGWVRSGSTVEIRQTSAATAGTDQVATLSVGTTTSTYVVRTQESTTPNAFTLAAATGSALNTMIQATPVTISGISLAVPISVSGEGTPQISLDNGVTWVSSGMVSPNGSVRVRLTSASSFDTTRTAVLDVNGVTSNWVVTTGPFTFALAGKTGVALNTVTVSDPVTLSAFLPPSAISLSGDGSPEYSIDGGAYTAAAGTVSGGQTLRVRLTASSLRDAERVATVTIGSQTANYSVRTAPPEACEAGAIGSVCSDGAVYAGIANGHKIFVAPASETGTFRYFTSDNATLGATSEDGLFNMWAVNTAVLANHAAFAQCAARAGGDWVLPSQSEMTVMRNNRASMPAGTYSFASAWYWTSTETDTMVGHAFTSYLTGTSTSFSSKSTANRVHCVRYSRDTPRPAITDPCSGTPTIGSLCADGSVYAGISDGKRIFFDTKHSANLAYKTTETFTAGSMSLTSAVQNRHAMTINGGLAVHPAQNFCANKGTSTSGSLWYLPSQGDLNVLTTNRAQGVLAQMFNASATGYVPANAWSSTQALTSENQATYMQKGGGFITTAGKTSATTAAALCVRFDAAQTYTDPCAGSPTAGALCADGSVFVSNFDGRQLRVRAVAGLHTLKAANTNTIGAISRDGFTNTNAILTAGTSNAAQQCRALGAQYNLPSIQEVTVIRGVLHGVSPINTNVWTSSDSGGGSAHISHTNGSTQSTASKTATNRVMCVSYGEEPRVAEDPCLAATPETGSLCADGSVYAGVVDGRRIYTSTADIGVTRRINSVTTAIPGTTSLTDGKANTDAMVGANMEAANACRALGAKWYLPALNELQVLRNVTSGTLSLSQTISSSTWYWSSTQSSTTNNHTAYLSSASNSTASRTTANRVRCVYSNVTAGF